MTILPKKKQSKDQSEGEVTDQRPSENRGQRRPTSSSRPSSPTRWSSSARDNRHDPGGLRYDYHEPGTSHHKRRHRSSPHRNARKHRHDRGAHSTTLNSTSSHTSLSGHGSPPPHGISFPRATPRDTVSCSEGQNPIDNEEVFNSGYNSGDEYVPPKHPENIEELEAWFEASIKAHKGFIIKRMGQDGACLFRAVADQLYGDQDMHSVVRQHCVDYMEKNEEFFSHYITEDFEDYLSRKRMEHIHGNHIEMQAMSELYNRPIEVYQYSLEPINTFHGAYKTDNVPLRLSYHGHVHYNSLVDPNAPTIGVGLGLPGYQPGLADKNLIQSAKQVSESQHIEEAMLEDKMRETDWEVTQETIEEQVARESYLQWLRDNEKRAKQPKSASATCSSASEAHKSWLDGANSPEARGSWSSPRSRMSGTGSGPSSPKDTEKVPSPALRLTHSPTAVEASCKLSPQRPSTSHQEQLLPSASLSLEGAVGGASSQEFLETASIFNELPPQAFGLADWSEEDVLSRVLAQSQQEYLENLKKKLPACSPSGSSSTSEDTHQYLLPLPQFDLPPGCRAMDKDDGNVDS